MHHDAGRFARRTDEVNVLEPLACRKLRHAPTTGRTYDHRAGYAEKAGRQWVEIRIAGTSRILRQRRRSTREIRRRMRTRTSPRGVSRKIRRSESSRLVLPLNR